MDLRVLLILIVEIFCVANSNFVFPVERRKTSLSEIKAHDDRRRGRFLSTVDFNLGGNGLPTETGLYFTKLGLGSPPKDYYVQVDTGSDILWVNCIECSRCPSKSNLGIDLTLYNPKDSKTSELISCDHQFCSTTYDGPIPGCKAEIPCPYSITYGDGSATSGYYVKDSLTFNRVTGNRQTAPQNSSIIFGCGNVQSGTLGSSSEEALDGIMGFGQANSSVLSQLAASGKVKKIFSHCLDTIHGGGIFAIGELVEPKVKTTPMVPHMTHYNVILKNIEVDGDVLQLPSDIFDSGNGKGAVIDSGTTLAYLPSIVYDQLIPKDGIWCIGWQKSASQTKSGRDMTLLGDLVLSNKLVLYDLENMAIGWTDYNCSSSIKVKDETTGIGALGHGFGILTARRRRRYIVFAIASMLNGQILIMEAEILHCERFSDFVMRKTFWWVPPPAGKFKLNVDGSFITSS
ncbi:Xylanase inhibitor, C-terminal [Sesbania bispinosa]|nr:Xylanase inhibitor, C-terminal [Sesbania bispinosa]